MQKIKLVWLVAIAFFVGLAIAAVALSEGGRGGILGGGTAEALLVQVSNVGHEARVQVLIHPVGSAAGSGRWEWIIASGGTQVARYPDPVGQQIVQVSAVWTDATGDRDGEVRFTPDPDECAGQTARLRVSIDTARGVVIRRDPTLVCE